MLFIEVYSIFVAD